MEPGSRQYVTKLMSGVYRCVILHSVLATVLVRCDHCGSQRRSWGQTELRNRKSQGAGRRAQELAV
jgi:hypothetical protein